MAGSRSCQCRCTDQLPQQVVAQLVSLVKNKDHLHVASVFREAIATTHQRFLRQAIGNLTGAPVGSAR
jgi:hypothetical protein